ncbi:MAG: LysM peptidoglycan-binding domain-containing protein [Saprospiraceae bacterium]|nr:LysM peptidoglycan-binding domain-containing protein [Saprospiraceae bacterium]
MKHFLYLSLYSISFLGLSETTIFAQSCPPSTVKNVHIVQKGETLYSLSRLYKTTVADLCALNNIREDDILPTCAALDVVNPTPPTPAKTAQVVPAGYNTVTVKSKGMPYFKSNKRIHIVKKGETLDMIAEYYGYTRARLLYMNNMTDAKDMKIGRELLVNDCISGTVTNHANTSAETPQSYSVVAKNIKTSNDLANTYATTNLNSRTYADNYSTYNLWTTSTHDGDMIVPTNYNWNPSYPKVIHVVSQDNLSQKETLESVGRLHGLSGAEVAAMNGLSTNSALVAGQKLIVEERLEQHEASSDGFMSMSSNPPTNIAPPQYTASLTDVPVPNFDTTPFMNAASTPIMENKTSMTPDEVKMVDEINLVRHNPAGYIVHIEKYIKDLERTQGNIAAINAARELITELFAMPVLSTLQPLECIYSAGKKYGIEQRQRGVADHQAADGSMPWDRIMRACPALKDGNENLVGGPADIREAVILLLVDNGIQNRGHRRTILQPNWKYIACHKMGQVGSMPNYWVQQFGN